MTDEDYKSSLIAENRNLSRTLKDIAKLVSPYSTPTVQWVNGELLANAVLDLINRRMYWESRA